MDLGWGCHLDIKFRRNLKRFRRWLVFEAHRLWSHSTLGSRVIKKSVVQVEPAMKFEDSERDALTHRIMFGGDEVFPPSTF